MDRSTKTLLCLILGIAALGCSDQQQANPAKTDTGIHTETMVHEDGAKSPSDQLHEIMMRPMQNMSMSGDVDKDFASMMAEHHDQAILMAQIEVQHGKNSELKQMAQQMIDSQKAEKERLEQIAQKPTGAKNEQASNEMHALMMKPMGDMSMAGDVDRDFAKMMADHHQGAIDMGKVLLEHGKDPELKKMVQKMVEDQTRERDLLMRHAEGPA